MAARVKSITGHQRLPVAVTWELCATAPDSQRSPETLAAASLEWTAAATATTAASALRAAGTWSLDGPTRRFDAQDWWFRARFPRPTELKNQRTVLGCDGLATVAEVWLNGKLLLSSDNMFIAHELDITGLLRDDNELHIRCRALDSLLTAKRPRPKWRAPMVENQQLRWFRTTLLGRTPGWSPPAAPVGPWRPTWLETRTQLSLTDLSIRTGVDDGTGWVEIECKVSSLSDGGDVAGVELVLERNAAAHSVSLRRAAGSDTFSGRLEIPDVTLWWPHTHGEPALYDARLDIKLASRAADAGPTQLPRRAQAQLRPVGFRTLALDTANGNFELRVNGVSVFCRGACWMPPDPVSFEASPEVLREALEQVRAAGMNMLRVGGMTVYESDEFLDGCDATGILIWQDFMFANMNYPEEDAAFSASVTAEARQQLARLAARPCLAVLCGNSEGEQQAAMWGAPRESWSPALFHELLPALARESCPDVPYWPSSAHGGAFPHQGNSGTTSYYGVGAYLLPLEDARRAEVRFASECLAFANVPEERTLTKMASGGAPKVHHPAWKARTPRDLGAGWDFDDVRDHYVRRLFGVDPLELRYADHERYLTLSRVAPGEVMAAVFAEWRRGRSSCHGGLIWFWRDLWCGAGWGVVDALGAPKAVYYYLRRVLQPRSVFISDEAGNGLYLNVSNEGPQPLAAIVELTLYRGSETVVARGERTLAVPARGSLELPATDWFEGFLDLSYAYRFGPPAHDLIVANLRDSDGTRIGQAFHFAPGVMAARQSDVGLVATATPRADSGFDLKITARRFAQSVWLDADGFRADDDYFHIAPGGEKTVVVRPVAGEAPRGLRGRISALNGFTSAKIDVLR